MQLDFKTFRDSLANAEPPRGMTLALQALWWDGKGDWAKAHERAQEREDEAGAHVHAYLHRKEGDASNAGYWYRRAGVRQSELTLEAEWAELVQGMLARG